MRVDLHALVCACTHVYTHAQDVSPYDGGEQHAEACLELRRHVEAPVVVVNEIVQNLACRHVV